MGLFPRLHYTSRWLCFYFSLNAWNLRRYWWIVRLIRAAAVLFDESHKKRTSYPNWGFKVSVIRMHWFSRHHITHAQCICKVQAPCVTAVLFRVDQKPYCSWVDSFATYMCSLQSPLFVFVFFIFSLLLTLKTTTKTNTGQMRRLYEYAANGTHNSPQVSLRTLYRSSMEICSHGAKEKQKPIRYMTIHFQSLARRTGDTETSLKSSRLCVTRSLISYGFRTGARAIRHSCSQ